MNSKKPTWQLVASTLLKSLLLAWQNPTFHQASVRK